MEAGISNMLQAEGMLHTARLLKLPPFYNLVCKEFKAKGKAKGVFPD